MYDTVTKIGEIVAVYGGNNAAGVSTTSAFLAATYAARNERTLILSTDPEIPYDGCSVLSEVVNDNRMDDLIILENSNALSTHNLESYVAMITNNLGYIRASSDVRKITKHPGETIAHIADIAANLYHHVIIDIAAKAGYEKPIFDVADIVVSMIKQSPKGILRAKNDYKNDKFGEDTLVISVVAGYEDVRSVRNNEFEKSTNDKDIIYIPRSADIFKAVATRTVANFVSTNNRKKPTSNILGFFKGKKKETESPELNVMDNYNALCDDISYRIALVKAEEEERSRPL